ncbi:hypothetical protein GDO78_006677 [Eleutherodactylus coqui]|uniref:Uncharacterized protein n=1 Tax=Eleutherodactylus coqui TaxID=57060 RepID=A0A8J6FDX0_ELECQ|nr:hypothetical protein GDO78_006677 [Eleutherodactylus coqui]
MCGAFLRELALSYRTENMRLPRQWKGALSLSPEYPFNSQNSIALLISSKGKTRKNSCHPQIYFPSANESLRLITLELEYYMSSNAVTMRSQSGESLGLLFY